jgi:hypothetical protein
MDYSKALQKKIIDFEAWITRDFIGEMPKDIPKEINVLYHENPTAYFYSRANLYVLIQELKGERGLLNDFKQLLADAKTKNSKYYDEFFTYYSEDNFINHFTDNRRNTVEIGDEIRKLNIISQQACFLYQSLYEVDAPFYILGVAGELAKNGKLNLSLTNLADNSGNLKKGVAIDYISSRLRNYPILKSGFDKAYNSKLRNTIGHNKYKRFDKEIKSLDGKISISISEFSQALYSLQSLNNAMINSLSLYQMEQESKDLSDCGIIAIGFFEYEDGTPGLSIFQLWCFYNIDLQKQWLSHVKFKILKSELKTQISKNAYQKGSINEVGMRWLKKVNELNSKQIKVAISPIYPRKSATAEIIETEFGQFEVDDDALYKEVTVEIVNPQ